MTDTASALTAELTLAFGAPRAIAGDCAWHALDAERLIVLRVRERAGGCVLWCDSETFPLRFSDVRSPAEAVRVVRLIREHLGVGSARASTRPSEAMAAIGAVTFEPPKAA